MSEPVFFQPSNAKELCEALRGQRFTGGVHYATQAEAWMRQAADEIERLSEINSRQVKQWNDSIHHRISVDNAQVILAMENYDLHEQVWDLRKQLEAERAR